MKAFFIYRDGELIGNPIGYTTIKGAQKSLVGSEDWYKTLIPYDKQLRSNKITEEQKNSKIWKYYGVLDRWIFDRNEWTKQIWTPYMKEHYKFVEKEFDIIFKD